MMFRRRVMAVITAVALMGGMVQVSSVLASVPTPLVEGRSEYRRIDSVHRYVLDVDSRTRLQVESRVWAGTSPNTVSLRAVLFDDEHRRVAEGRSRRGLFVLEERLDPGRYTLEVRGRHLGGKQESSNHYYLNVRMD
jgi:hypothetical protein